MSSGCRGPPNVSKSIFQSIPNASDLIEIEPLELAGYLLEHLHSISSNRDHRFQSDNLANEISRHYPIGYKERVFDIIKQGYQWLKNHDYIFDRTTNGFFDFTDKGNRLKTAEAFQHSLRSEATIDSSLPTQLIKSTLAANLRSADPSTAIGNNDELLLSKRYRIIRTLTATGFAQTFLGEDTLSPSKRKCVIKQFAYTSTDPQTYQLMLERFEREAVNLERLAEDNDQVPDLYAHFSQDGKYYLVQEYIEGDTVAAKIANSGTFSELTVKEILRSLLLVLKYVHAHSLIHRDIKPENIMLRARDGKPFLIDFGAIKEIAHTMVDTFGNPSTSIKIGTLGYMPLEQAAGRPVLSSDLYSLGLTAIFMLTGKRPEALNDLRSGEIVWLSHAENVSVTFRAFLDKSIRSDFHERFPGAQEMLDALDMGVPDALPEDPHVINLGTAPSRLAVSGPIDANMPQVATQWLGEFLSPVIELLNNLQK